MIHFAAKRKKMHKLFEAFFTTFSLFSVHREIKVSDAECKTFEFPQKRFLKH